MSAYWFYKSFGIWSTNLSRVAYKSVCYDTVVDWAQIFMNHASRHPAILAPPGVNIPACSKKLFLNTVMTTSEFQHRKFPPVTADFIKKDFLQL